MLITVCITAAVN